MDSATLALWVAAIGTSGSLLLGFYILLGDRRRSEQEQANQLAWWTNWYQMPAGIDGPKDRESTRFEVHLDNHANETVFSPKLRAKPRSPWFIRFRLHQGKLLNEFKRRLAGSRFGPTRELVMNPQGYLVAIPNGVDRIAQNAQEIANMGHGVVVDSELGLHLSHDEHTTLRLTFLAPMNWYKILLTFTDSHNRTWERNVMTAHLKQIDRPAPKNYWSQDLM